MNSDQPQMLLGALAEAEQAIRDRNAAEARRDYGPAETCEALHDQARVARAAFISGAPFEMMRTDDERRQWLVARHPEVSFWLERAVASLRDKTDYSERLAAQKRMYEECREHLNNANNEIFRLRHQVKNLERRAAHLQEQLERRPA